jgi:organic hydroperoxide reductase OsmC/OhrA
MRYLSPGTGAGTSGYRDYSRNYEIVSEGKPAIQGSGAIQGDRACWNPEELLVASLSACHKLVSPPTGEAGIIVTAYADRAEGVMEVGRDGTARFKSVMLHPTVTVATGSDVKPARTLHKPAHEEVPDSKFSQFPCRVRAGNRRDRLSGGTKR